MEKTNGLILLLSIWVLKATWVHGIALTSPHAMITPAPVYNQPLQARQDSGDSVTCTNWAMTSPHIQFLVCPASSTCIVEEAGFGAGCYLEATTEWVFTTACNNYPTTWSGSASPAAQLFCSQEAPSCGQLIYSFSGQAWTAHECSTAAFTYTALFESATDSPVPLQGVAATSGSYLTPTPVATTGGSQFANTAVIGGVVGGVVGTVAIIGICVFIWHQKRTKKIAANRAQRASQYPMDNAQYYAQEEEKRGQFEHMEQLPEEFPEEYPVQNSGGGEMPSRFAGHNY